MTTDPQWQPTADDITAALCDAGLGKLGQAGGFDINGREITIGAGALDANTALRLCVALNSRGLQLAGSRVDSYGRPVVEVTRRPGLAGDLAVLLARGVVAAPPGVGARRADPGELTSSLGGLTSAVLQLTVAVERLTEQRGQAGSVI